MTDIYKLFKSHLIAFKDVQDYLRESPVTMGDIKEEDTYKALSKFMDKYISPNIKLAELYINYYYNIPPKNEGEIGICVTNPSTTVEHYYTIDEFLKLIAAKRDSKTNDEYEKVFGEGGILKHSFNNNNDIAKEEESESMINESTRPKNLKLKLPGKEEINTKINNNVIPITFDESIYLAVFNSFENSYLCEKPGYVVFRFNENAKSTTSGKGATLYITDTNPHWSENPLPYEVDKNSSIYVCAGSRIYVQLGYESLGDPYVTAEFVPITHAFFDKNKSIIKQVIDQNNKEIRKTINEEFGKLLK